MDHHSEGYAKRYYRQVRKKRKEAFHFSFDRRSDADVIERLNAQTNCTEYVRRLVRAEIKEAKKHGWQSGL